MIDLVRRHVRSAIVRARPYAVRDVHVEHAALLIDRTIPQSGAVAQAAERAGVETFFLEDGDDPALRAVEALEVGDDALGVAGADSLLGPVAAVAVAQGVPLFCATPGSRSPFARDLRLDQHDSMETLAAMGRAEEILVDYGLANGRPFVNHVAVGYLAERMLGGLSGAELFRRGAPSDGGRLRYASPAGPSDDHTALLVVSNNPAHLTGHPDVGRRMRLDTGVLGLAALGSLPHDATPQTSLSSCPSWREWSDTRFRVESDGPILAMVDGAPVEFTSPLDIVSRRKALAVLVPAGTRPGYLPSRQTGDARLIDLPALIGCTG